MAYIEDLAPCKYIPMECEALTSVGWLARDKQFTRDDVPREFFEKLDKLCKSPWQPVVSAGFHICELCQYHGPASSANLYVPYEGRIYIAPVAIVHYVAAHWYRPPEVFIRAVLECPEMNSMNYKKALLANGGRELIRN